MHLGGDRLFRRLAISSNDERGGELRAKLGDRLGISLVRSRGCNKATSPLEDKVRVNKLGLYK
jgi:hypothetical protein